MGHGGIKCGAGVENVEYTAVACGTKPFCGNEDAAVAIEVGLARLVYIDCGHRVSTSRGQRGITTVHETIQRE